MVSVESLVFDPANARKHDERNIKAIMDSLERHGQRKPIVCYSNMVVAGNGTLQAAKRLGWTEIWVNDDGFASIEDAKAYAIQDNRSAELAAWDDVQLGDTLTELKEAGWDLEEIGFDDSDLKDLMDKPQGTDGLTDADEVPEVEQNEYGVKRGDIWILGNHRLMCGDSTLSSDCAALMNGEKADMVFTDPPYGIAYKGGSKEREEIKNDAIDVLPFYKSFLTLAKEHTVAGGAIYIWHASSETHNCINAAIESGWLFKSYLVWVKNNSTFGRSDYHWQHEPAFYGWGADGTHKWFGDRKQTTTWMIDRPSRSEDHPTMKPVELCERGIINSSGNGQKVYEPFCGSGSTLIACEKTGRKCYGMELDEHYCSVIIKRWQDFTGKKAERIVEGA
jgi:DNA modification methylase